MMVSGPLFFYHLHTAYTELIHYPTGKWIYIITAIFTILLYSVGLFTDNRRIGQITHSMMHIIGVIGSGFMYCYLSQERYLMNKLAT